MTTFNNMEEVIAAVRNMTDDQLVQLATLAQTEHENGNITKEDLKLVASVIFELVLERALLALIPTPATVH